MASEPLTLSKILKLGSIGAEVSRVQERLNFAGSRPHTRPDGIFGQLTEQSVRHFQTAHALGVDGRVGSETWRALSRVAGPRPSPVRETPAAHAQARAAETSTAQPRQASTVSAGRFSPAFVAFMPFILQWEGGSKYTNNPDDPGGATKYGISQRAHPGLNIRNLTEEDAVALYWEEWCEAGCDKMSSPYAEVYFNCAVNMGKGRAKQFGAAAGGSAPGFIDLQEAKYRSLANANPKLRKFLKGWLNRTTALRTRFGL